MGIYSIIFTVYWDSERGEKLHREKQLLHSGNNLNAHLETEL